MPRIWALVNLKGGRHCQCFLVYLPLIIGLPQDHLLHKALLCFAPQPHFLHLKLGKWETEWKRRCGREERLQCCDPPLSSNLPHSPLLCVPEEEWWRRVAGPEMCQQGHLCSPTQR